MCNTELVEAITKKVESVKSLYELDEIREKVYRNRFNVCTHVWMNFHLIYGARVGFLIGQIKWIPRINKVTKCNIDARCMN